MADTKNEVEIVWKHIREAKTLEELYKIQNEIPEVDSKFAQMLIWQGWLFRKVDLRLDELEKAVGGKGG